MVSAETFTATSVNIVTTLLRPPYGIGQAIIFLPRGLFLLSSLYLFCPLLISAVRD